MHFNLTYDIMLFIKDWELGVLQSNTHNSNLQKGNLQ